MKNKSGRVTAIKAIFVAICLTCTVLLCTVNSTCLVQEHTAEEKLGGILSYNGAKNDDIQGFIDTHLCGGAGDGYEWYILSLSQYGDYSMHGCEQALLEYLDVTDVYSFSSRLKYALCLASVGSTDEYILRSLEECTGKQGLMSWVFGLHLLNNGYTCDGLDIHTVQGELLALECDGGGWSISGGVADTDATAMVIQALSPYYKNGGEVVEAIDRGLELLSCRLSENADYSSYGVPNAESTAQVIIALTSLGIDLSEDGRFVTSDGKTLLDGLERYRLESGGYSHTEGGGESKMATEQCFMAYVSYIRQSRGKGSIYMLDRADPDGAQRPSITDDTVEGVTENVTEGAEDDNSRSGPASFGQRVKICISIIAVCLGTALCIIFAIKGVRKAGGFIAIILAVCLLVGVVWLIDIKTPDEHYSQLSSEKDGGSGTVIGHVTVEVRCDTVAGKSESAPSDGEIIGLSEVEIYEGDTAYSVLCRAAAQKKINVSSRGGSQSLYVYGISTLYEFDFGELSGWMYHVNGDSPNVSASEYRLSDGDRVQWLYTCDLGNDLENGD